MIHVYLWSLFWRTAADSKQLVRIRCSFSYDLITNLYTFIIDISHEGPRPKVPRIDNPQLLDTVEADRTAMAYTSSQFHSIGHHAVAPSIHGFMPMVILN